MTNTPTKSRLSDVVIISIITGVVSLISLYMTLTIKGQVKDVHQQLNSMRDQENKTNKELGHAEGKEEGKAIEKQDQKTEDSLDEKKH